MLGPHQVQGFCYLPPAQEAKCCMDSARPSFPRLRPPHSHVTVLMLLNPKPLICAVPACLVMSDKRGEYQLHL